MKYRSSLFVCLVVPALAVAGCSFDGADSSEAVGQPLGGEGGDSGGECVLDPISIEVLGSSQSTIDLQVCAGDSGAPGGFSLGWMAADEFATLGQQWPGDECTATFGDPLDPNECVNLSLGDLMQDGLCDQCKELECGTEYVVHGRAEGFCECAPSGDSCTKHGSTEECKEEEKGCTLTQGFWKNHPDAWPVSSLTLGSVSYSEAQLISILKTPPAGNGLIQLAHQLTAAKLNIAAGADDSDIAAAIAAADALIDGLTVPPIGSGFLSPSDTSSLIDALTAFNEGATGPGHCEEEGDKEKAETPGRH